MVQDDKYLYSCPVFVPTVMGGKFLLQSLQFNSMVMYKPLVPVSAIAVSFG